jgi:cellulose synthase/poly-beta-1,6-N-acetylglucosamine synthase-like glycosyltransferase
LTTNPPAPLSLLPFAIALALAIFLFTSSIHLLLNPPADALAPLHLRVAVVIGIVSLVVSARWMAFFILAFISHARLRTASAHTPTHWPRVSILVPAYNESETIAPALQSLLDLDYPRYEIIVVDDGSKDDTFARAEPFEGEHAHRSIRVFTKPNGGKWAALNFAFARATSDLVLCVDADSRLDREALRHLVARLADPAVSAVSGQVRVRNRVNLLTKLQAMEYIIANGLIRLAQSLSGTVLVIPGPIGLFRRDVLEQVFHRFGRETPIKRPGEHQGPFEGDTFAEDFDLSLAILALGGRTVYEPAAVSHTKAPDTSFRLLNQRYRWGRGTLQVLRKYLRRSRTDRTLAHPRLLTWLSITYVLELAIVPLVNLAAIASILLLVATGADLLPLLTWLAAFALLNLNAAAFFASIHRDSLRLALVMPIYDLYHAFLLNAGWLIALIDELRGVRMRW